jgi:DNA-3-methyladenine glycosylase II
MRDKRYLEYGEKEVAYLKTRDPALAKVMDEVGHVKREIIPDMFTALIHSIIGQQISGKARITVWERMKTMFAPLTPENMVSIPVETLQTCGISMRKAAFIREIASKVHSGNLDLAQLHSMDDEAVCKRLSEIKGIGVWTAEMLMTFSMQRMDVLSWGDLAIQRGLRMLYRHRKISPALFARYKKRYSPYSTVASIYLWALAGGACAGYTDSAPKSDGQKKSRRR